MKINRRSVLALLICATALLAVFFLGLGTDRLLHHRSTVHTMRADLLAQFKADPARGWSHRSSHVVVAWPGVPLANKGYLEPGGSFSPGVGSFGIDIQAGRCNSATLSLAEVHEQLEGYGVRTVTPCYNALWTAESPGVFRLEVTPADGLIVHLKLSGAGPAAGPLNSVDATAQGLIVNDAWRIESASTPLAAPSLSGPENWRQADLPLGTVRVLRIRPLFAPAHADQLAIDGVLDPLPRINVPDARFRAALTAQVLHLRMSTVGDQTRPGDPVNYPQPWVRDGAYQIVALARAGQLHAARQLALGLARDNYTGGFGPEADAPGIALWAFVETADRLHDPAFEASLWPAVLARAHQIERLRRATLPTRGVWLDPVVPAHATSRDLDLIAEPARDGLIVGRMDWSRPLLYVNGTAYAGLRAAARLAARQPGQQNLSACWNASADDLHNAWVRQLDRTRRADVRDAIIGLWPSTVASDQIARYIPVLRQLWEREHNSSGDFRRPPLWSYFQLAEAHQWLLSGQPDGPARTWKTLNWFLDHSAADGLYTWCEGNGEENNSGLWQRLAGWTAPPCVTPHYWTAAEMLALQLDMLVHEAPDGTLDIGLGVPASWLAQPLEVDGILTTRGSVHWRWDGHALSVQLNGQPVAYRPGPAFTRPPVQ